MKVYNLWLILAFCIVAQLPQFYQHPNKFVEITEGHINGFSDSESSITGKEFLLKSLELKEDEIELVQSISSDGMDHLYFTRLLNGVRIENQMAQVHLRIGSVVTWSTNIRPKQFRIDTVKRNFKRELQDINESIRIASSLLNGTKDSQPAILAYLEEANGKLIYVRQFQIRNYTSGSFYHVSSDAYTGELIRVVNYVKDFSAQYKVVPFGQKIEDGLQLMRESEQCNKFASPYGWHSPGLPAETIGNNVLSKIYGKTISGGGESLFDGTFNYTQAVYEGDNRRLAVINSFYLANIFHDIMYFYGFDENAGCFQSVNYNSSEPGNDPVLILNQERQFDNANFVSPPDGQSGELRLFLWTKSKPLRDTVFDQSVIIHELTHGLSDRLTGGSKRIGCLVEELSSGLAEGWSDAFAFILLLGENAKRDNDYIMGEYVMAGKRNPYGNLGQRDYPYSTSSIRHPYMYSRLQMIFLPHQIGEVWAEMLYELYWDFRDNFGFSSNLYDSNQKKGNIILMKLLITGMKLQPCNPSFIDARDAILSADRNLYNGAYRCLIFTAFARRGLGNGAINPVPRYVSRWQIAEYKNDFNVPDDCQ